MEDREAAWRNLGSGEHWPVTCGQLELSPLRSNEFASPGEPAVDHLVYLSKLETTQDPHLGQRFSGGVL
jgi:hypothetical protein